MSGSDIMVTPFNIVLNCVGFFLFCFLIFLFVLFIYYFLLVYLFINFFGEVSLL